jgi:hypothetical protein
MEATMATKITVVLEDDRDDGPADETVRSEIDGTEYEIHPSRRDAGTTTVVARPARSSLT